MCVFACIRVSMSAYARARARVYAVCVRVHIMYAHNIYPHCIIVELYNHVIIVLYTSCSMPYSLVE